MYYLIDRVVSQCTIINSEVIVSGLCSLLFGASAVSFLYEQDLQGMIFLTSAVAVFEYAMFYCINNKPRPQRQPSTNFKMRMINLNDLLPNTLPKPEFLSTTVSIPITPELHNREVDGVDLQANPQELGAERIDSETFENGPNPNMNDIKKAVIGKSYLKAEEVLREIDGQIKLLITNKEIVTTFPLKQPEQSEGDVEQHEGEKQCGETKFIRVEVSDKSWLGTPTKNTLIVKVH